MRHIALTGFVFAALAVPWSVQAAPAPSSEAPTPGAVQATLPKPPPPEPKKTPDMTPPPSAAPSVAPGGMAVTVKRFAISGNTVYDDATLAGQIASYVGRSMTLKQLYDVATVLTRYYQSHGYGLARVTVPQQAFADGTVKLTVVEGTIGKVSVQGNTRTHSAAILKQASSAQSGAVYQNKAVERAVLLVNDLPGVQARAVMEPGEAFGSAGMVLNVKETPYSGYVSIDDYGRPSIGRWRLNAGVNVNSLTHRGDKLSASMTHSSGDLLNFGNLGYSLPVGPAGGTLSASYNRAVYHVGGSQFGPLKISGATSNATAMYQYAQWRTTTKSLYWGVGMVHTSSNADSAGTPIAQTSINLLQLSAYYLHLHRDGSYYTVGGQFYTNGQSYDANAAKSGKPQNSEKARLVVDSTYVKPFARKWRLTAKGGVQWSADPLVDNDKYSLGGPYSVRGFLSAEQRGDSAVYASGEVARSLNPTWGVWLGAFVDSGKIWNKAAGGAPSNQQTLTGAGLDLSLTPPDSRWNARVQWAYAIGGYQPSDGNAGGHIWATVGMNF